jgi:GT2 family glycosyltransferase
MNILFVLYSDFRCNTSNPISAFSNQLILLGHDCVVIVPNNEESISHHPFHTFTPATYNKLLEYPEKYFKNGKKADLIHACTPRIGVSSFVINYMAKWPTPLIIFHEDNEEWITKKYLDISENEFNKILSDDYYGILPKSISHPIEYRSFLSLADKVLVIQPKLLVDIPSWVDSDVIMLGVDLNLFSPQKIDQNYLTKFGIEKDEKVIVYTGGIDKYKLPAIKELIKAVQNLNRSGIRCHLIRTGEVQAHLKDELDEAKLSYIHDLGIINKNEIPKLLNHANVLIQPGFINEFEDLRLPGKLPEFMAIGKPVIIPNVNISFLLRDNEDVIILNRGDAQEIEEKCKKLFYDEKLQNKLSINSRQFAIKHFNIITQAKYLERNYISTIEKFSIDKARIYWEEAFKRGLQSSSKLKFESLQSSFNLDIFNSEKTNITNNILNKLNQLIFNYEQRLLIYEKCLSERNSKINKQNSAIIENEFFNKKIINELNQLLVSRSWKLTKPLREINRLIVLVNQINKRVIVSIKINGLLWSVKRIILKILNKDNTYKSTYIIKNKNDYDEWINRYENISLEQNKLSNLNKKDNDIPFYSIINCNLIDDDSIFFEIIKNINLQTYDNWELLLYVKYDKFNHFENLLKRELFYKKVKIFKENLSKNFNEEDAINQANGNWIVFLNKAKLLRWALSIISNEIIINPKLKIIYSDDDIYNINGTRSNPNFKPDLNIDLFYSNDYIGDSVFYSKELITRIGNIRPKFKNARFFDLRLRCLDVLNSNQIKHSPYLLFHYQNEESDLISSQIGRIISLQESFIKKSINATAISDLFGIIRIRYHLNNNHPLVSIIIPTRDKVDLLKKCIESIFEKTIYNNYEIIIVDNNSIEQKTFEYFDLISKKHNVKIISDKREFNYSALNNYAMKFADGEFLVLLNNDIEIISTDWLLELIGIASQPNVGVVGARLWYPDNTLQHGGVILGVGSGANHAHTGLKKGQTGYQYRAICLQSMSVVTAACLAVRKELYESVGGLDEVNLPVAFNDVDFCLKILEKNLRNVWTPYAELYHHESVSRGNDDSPKKRKRFNSELRYIQSKWLKYIHHDPAYNSNLSITSNDFSLAWPPRIK